MTTLQIRLSDNLYLKDPQSTELGRKIVASAITLIDRLGFEAFTFRKLSVAIESTEASIYRYFENKHRLLVYLNTWYWSWLEFRIATETSTLSDNREKLDRILYILTEKTSQDPAFPDIDEAALQRIVIAESDKTYLTKQVDADNRDGLFRGYKSLCSYITALVRAINPAYAFPSALVSTILEASHQQIFFARHLPSLTELSQANDPYQMNYQFIRSIIFSAIET